MATDTDIDLGLIWNALVRDCWIVIVLSLLGLAGAGLWAWRTPGWYRTELLMLPEYPFGSAFGWRPEATGVVDVGTSTLSSNNRYAPLVVLRSQEFARKFLVDEGLVDKVSGLAGVNADVEAAVSFFTGRVRSIRKDPDTDGVFLNINWVDAATAADIANRMAARLNRVTRDGAIAETTASIGILRGQLAESQDDAQRRAIGRMLEAEYQKLALAKGREQFAFRIAGAAPIPAATYWPRRGFVMVAGAACGLMLALVVVFLRIRVRKPAITQRADAFMR